MKPTKATAAASRSQGAAKRKVKASKKQAPAPSKRPAPKKMAKKAPKKGGSRVKKIKRGNVPLERLAVSCDAQIKKLKLTVTVEKGTLVVKTPNNAPAGLLIDIATCSDQLIALWQRQQMPDPAARVSFTKGRPPGLDISWRQVFLTELSSVPFVTHAAEKAGTTPQTAYAHRKADPEFAKAWDEAIAQGNTIAPDRLQKTAWDLAVVGVVRQKFGNEGQLLEEWVERDGKLLALMLKAKCPEFREKVEHSGNVKFIPLNELAQRVSEAGGDDDDND